MKRILIVLSMVALIISGCTIMDKTSGESMSKMNNQQKPFIFLNTLSVFQNDDAYRVVVEEDGKITKTVTFSLERKSYNNKGLKLIKDEDINQYVGLSIDELQETLGEIHADIGSGFYVPVYITQEAHLICFALENNIVVEVIKRDILTKTIVERSSAG